MVQKPKIQYVGQFYVHGSEARKLEQPVKKNKTVLPLKKLQQIETIYVDPVALMGIAVAVVMLAVMLVGALQIREDWAEYESVSNYVSYLNQENARLTREYHESFDLEAVRTKALALGMVPKEEAEVTTIQVLIPQRSPEPSRLELLKEFLEGLFA